MYLSEEIQKKWSPVLEHPDLGVIKDSYRKAVTAIILENQEKALREEKGIINEAGTGDISYSDYVNRFTSTPCNA